MSERDATGRFVDGRERRMMFMRGFGDGAKFSAKKWPDDPDYEDGWSKGYAARNAAERAFTAENDLPPPSILRLQGLPRTPEGDVNNCGLAFFGDLGRETECQMCNGNCPDKERLMLAGRVS